MIATTYPAPFFPHLEAGSTDYRFALGRRWAIREFTQWDGSRRVHLLGGNDLCMYREGATFSGALADLLVNAPFLGDAEKGVIRKRIATLEGAGL